MLRVLIVDDEEPARNRLRRMLVDIPGVCVAGEAATGADALRLIPVTAAQVLLLDISMPGLDGMTLARTLRQQGSVTAIIFCTAWSDQAVEAFEHNAVDYLIKPVRAQRLETALIRARQFLDKQGDAPASPMLRSMVGGKVSLLPLSEVIYLYAEQKYTVAVHENGSMVINRTLADIESTYKDVLIRIHRSALVAKNCIRGLEKPVNGRHNLILHGCEERPQVSRRNLPAIRKLIRELIE